VSPHHYLLLLRRWKEVARRARIKCRPLVTVSGLPLIYLETPASAFAEPVYLSAGIHGDEAGSTEGLLAWAEKEAANLRNWPLLLFPCLNPWGLQNNVRTDEHGVDLNRAFHTDHPTVMAMKEVLGTRQCRVSVHLHEDYDGEGVYVYELARREVWGEALLAAASSIIPPDPRRKIDISRATNGLVRRRITRKRFADIGYPEAAWLFFEHTDHAFTVETPSEFALERRVEAHVAMLDELARRELRSA
jgi:murein peptide amidase A